MIFNVISTEEGIKSVPFVDVVDVSPLMAVMVLLGTMQRNMPLPASTAATYSGINVLFNVDTLALSSSTSLA